jgi:hypothetical protein
MIYRLGVIALLFIENVKVIIEFTSFKSGMMASLIFIKSFYCLLDLEINCSFMMMFQTLVVGQIALSASALAVILILE